MPAQLDLDGNEHARRSDPPAACEAVPLFNAPPTMHGQQTLGEPAHVAAMEDQTRELPPMIESSGYPGPEYLADIL